MKQYKTYEHEMVDELYFAIQQKSKTSDFTKNSNISVLSETVSETLCLTTYFLYYFILKVRRRKDDTAGWG